MVPQTAKDFWVFILYIEALYYKIVVLVQNTFASVMLLLTVLDNV